MDQKRNHFIWREKLLAVVLMVLLLVGLTASTGLGKADAAPGFSLDWNVISGGGLLTSTGGSYSLSGTIAQPGVGPSQLGAPFTLNGGFWYGISPSRVFVPLLKK